MWLDCCGKGEDTCGQEEPISEETVREHGSDIVEYKYGVANKRFSLIFVYVDQ